MPLRKPDLIYSINVLWYNIEVSSDLEGDITSSAEIKIMYPPCRFRPRPLKYLWISCILFLYLEFSLGALFHTGQTVVRSICCNQT